MPRKKQPPKEKDIHAVLNELNEFLEEFNINDPEDVQTRKDRLITAFARAGLLKKKAWFRDIQFHEAIQGLQLNIANKHRMIISAERFEDLTNSYGDDPSQDDMSEAYELLDEIADELRKPLLALLGIVDAEQLEL
jgi:hypothetical protein